MYQFFLLLTAIHLTSISPDCFLSDIIYMYMYVFCACVCPARKWNEWIYFVLANLNRVYFCLSFELSYLTYHGEGEPPMSIHPRCPIKQNKIHIESIKMTQKLVGIIRSMSAFNPPLIYNSGFGENLHEKRDGRTEICQ